MGLAHSPSIVTSNLVFAIDAANIKSINLPTQADHGWADWYCLVSGTATYSIIDEGISIFERTSAGAVTTVVGPTTGPTRGSLTVTAGNTYYGDGPINLIVEDGHHCLAPTTMSGTLFWNDFARAGVGPYMINVYSPYGAAQLKFYDSVSSGINSPPTSVLNVAQGSVTVFSTANNNGVFASNGQVWLTSNVPIVATANSSIYDKTILTPMSQYVYRRYPAYYSSQSNNYGTLVSNYYTLYDSNTANKVMDMNVADGSGGDAAQGLGLDYLSENYSWGNYLSDYHITAPYANTIVNVQHWNGSVWTTLESHTLNGGTIQNAVAVFRDGTANVGNAGSIVSGAASYFNASRLWKWTGNKPFYLIINDTLDDEFAVLGWSNASVSKRPRTSNAAMSIISNGDNAFFFNGASVSNGSFTFDGTNDFCLSSSIATYGNNTTWEAWVYCTGDISTFNMFMGRYLPYFSFFGGNRLYFSNMISGTQRVVSTATNLSTNTWYHAAFTTSYDGANTTMKIYTNGVETASGSWAGTQDNYSYKFMIGDGNLVNNSWYPFQGQVSAVKVYNKTLTPEEIQQNFNALRGRFGI